MRAQIEAAESIGTNGWMLWNLRNRYSRGDVRTDGAASSFDTVTVRLRSGFRGMELP